MSCHITFSCAKTKISIYKIFISFLTGTEDCAPSLVMHNAAVFANFNASGSFLSSNNATDKFPQNVSSPAVESIAVTTREETKPDDSADK